MSSFEGTQVYPKEKTKEEIFEDSVKEQKDKYGSSKIPYGVYYLNRKVKDFGHVKGKAVVEDGIFKVLKGSICAPNKTESIPAIRNEVRIENNILMEDVICNSPSTADVLIIGSSNNGWKEWKNEKGQSIDIYRNKN